MRAGLVHEELIEWFWFAIGRSDVSNRLPRPCPENRMERAITITRNRNRMTLKRSSQTIFQCMRRADVINDTSLMEEYYND